MSANDPTILHDFHPPRVGHPARGAIASYDSLNRLRQAQTRGTTTGTNATNYSWDANGNLTGSSAGLSLAYNAKKQTSSITPPGGSAIAMTYAGLGQAERTQAGSTSYVHDLLGIGSETTSSGTTFYVRKPDGRVLGQRTPTGTYHFMHDAHPGSVVTVLDNTGSANVPASYDYDPSGEPINTRGTLRNPWRFAGEYHDEATNLYKIGHRYYDAQLGRWTQQDSIVGFEDPRQANRYTYAAHDPVNLNPTLDTRAPHRRARTGRVGNYVATSGEFLVAAVRSAGPSSLVPDYSARGFGEYNGAGLPKNHYVRPYVRRDGTFVSRYWRNSPSDGRRPAAWSPAEGWSR